MTIDFTCNTTLDCFNNNATIIRECYLDIDNRCACSVIFGWVGDNCDEVSPQLTYERIVETFLLIWSIVLVILALRVLILNSLYEGITWTALSVTTYSATATTLGVLTFYINHIPSHYDSTAFVVEAIPSYVVESPVTVHRKGTVLAQTSFIFVVCSIIFSSFALMLSWQDIITKISTYQSFKSARAKKQQSVSLRVLGAILISLPILLLIVGEIAGALLCAIGLGFFAAPLAFYVARGFGKALRSILIQHKHKELIIIVKLVRSISIVIVTCLTVQSVCILASLLTYDNNRENFEFGRFRYNLLINDITALATFVQITSIVWYVNSVSVGPIVAEAWYPRLCAPFRLWDSMNKKLIPEEATITVTGISTLFLSSPRPTTAKDKTTVQNYMESLL